MENLQMNCDITQKSDSLELPKSELYCKYWPKVFVKITLRKHAYSNILKILPPKNENFQMKNSDIFHISAQNIDCGTR